MHACKQNTKEGNIMDLLIKNGTVVTACGSYIADVAVNNGKIVEIGKDLSSDAEKVVDATGKLVLPGALDVHTHLAMPFGGNSFSRQLSSGTRAAACGGVTTILIIPFSTKAKRLWDLSIPKKKFLSMKHALTTLFIAV